MTKTAALASAWFQNIFHGSDKDLVLTEGALKTEYGTVTWLTANPQEVVGLRSILIDH
jgi:hypothetical protein